MKNTSFHILRVGIGIMFVWIGVLIFRSSQEWGFLLQPWAAGLLPIPLEKAMFATAVLDIVIGLALLTDMFVFWVATAGFFHLVTVITVTGITSITVRDIGIAAATLALMVNSWPVWLWPRRRALP